VKNKCLDLFIEVYKKEFGVELSVAEATQKATKLIELYKLLSSY
jgi:hypothetical protein